MDKKNVLTLLCYLEESHKHLMIFFLVQRLVETILQWLPLTRTLKEFFLQFKPGIWWTSINHYHGFHALAKRNSFPVSRALGGKCRCLSRFCNILLQNLTPLRGKITRSTNLLSICRRKLKLSTYLNTVSYNHISFLGNTR